MHPWLRKGLGRYDESKHRRSHGRFATTGGAGAGGKPKPVDAAGRAVRQARARKPGPEWDRPATPAEPGPVRPGHVRLYHGGRHAGTGGGRWVTGSRDYAQGYADKSGGQLHYADVPATHPAVAPLLDELEESIGSRDARHIPHFEAPEDIARQLRPHSPAPGTSAKPVGARGARPAGRPRDPRHNPDLDAAFGIESNKPKAPPAADAFADYRPGTQDLRQFPKAPAKPVAPLPIARHAPPALPHERSQAAALGAARAVQPGDAASHAAAVQALDAHRKAGLAELKRRAAQYGPRGGNVYRKAAQAFAAKLSAARARIDQIAGKGPPPVPRRGGPPPLADRGRVKPFVSMKALHPWLTGVVFKRRFVEGEHPRGRPENAGEFTAGGAGAKGPKTGKNPATDRGADALRSAVARARAKVKACPVPDAAAVKAAHARMDAVGADRYEADIRGNTSDRAASRKRLLTEFGDGTSCPCVYCGLKLVDEDGPNLVTRDKIKTARQGGRYSHANLLPACLACNKRRSDTPIEKVKWARA